jgi:hypothetical protein
MLEVDFNRWTSAYTSAPKKKRRWIKQSASVRLDSIYTSAVGRLILPEANPFRIGFNQDVFQEYEN